jgi:arylsulfatase A-like enzyme
MAQPAHGAANLTTGALLTVALVLAALAGLAESTLLGVARYGLGRFTHLNPHFAYLAPLWYMALVLILVAPLLMLGGRSSQRVRIGIAVLPVVLLGGLGALFLYSRLSRWAALALAAGVAIQAVRVVAARPALVHRIARRTLPVLVLVIAGIAVALNAPAALAERRALARIAPDADKPNVLFIIWDTVRAASLSLHGYQRPTTPTLDRLAAESVVFDRAYSVAPWTLPAHASLFTGRIFPAVTADWFTPLEEGPATLAEVFARNGYATGGFVANYFYCSRESGLDRGFHRYDVYPTPSIAQFALGSSVARAFFNNWTARRALGFTDKPGRKEASGVNAEFVQWLDRLDGRPFFAFLNYFDAHAPYLPPAPWDTMFGPLLPGRDPSMTEGRSFTPRELQAEIDAYDGGIRSLDDHLALLVEDLERRGILNNTIIVVTSDHGEEFGEHGVFTHGNTLYERSLHVPLLIRAPMRAPGGVRVAEWISTNDVAATIASLAALDSGLGGASLERFWASTADPARTPGDARARDTLLALVSYARGHPPDYPVSLGDMQTVLAEPYQLIRAGDGSERLFDLTDSVSALVDLSSRADAAEVRARLKAYVHRALPLSASATSEGRSSAQGADPAAVGGRSGGSGQRHGAPVVTAGRGLGEQPRPERDER